MRLRAGRGPTIDDRMIARTASPAVALPLVALVLILVALVVSYLRARSSDQGHYDDSPAAEVGAGVAP